MGSARPFPFDEVAIKPVSDRAAPRALPANAAVQEAAPSWPILARIGTIVERNESTGSSEPAGGHSYRVDAPHAAAPPTHASPSKVAPRLKSAASKPPGETADKREQVLSAAPLPIRMTVQTWRFVQPYMGIIRFAAMLALMAIGGTSMTLMMGGSLRQGEAPPSTNATAVDQTSTLESTPATVEPKLPLEGPTAPDAKSSSLAPTAVGPAAQLSKPIVAIESTEPAEENPIPLAEKAPAVAESTATLDDASAPYPTTPYATVALPPAADEPWPKVQTSEPSIARLKGVVLETETR